MALTGFVAAPSAQAQTITPIGEWLTYANGQVRIQSAIPEKAEYAVGDVVTLRFRMESTAQAPAWTETPAGGAPVVTTIYGALPVAQATPEPGESTWSWL